MKKNTLFICFAMLVSLNGTAQSLAPEISTIEHNDKMRTCLMVKLEPEPKTLKKAWISFLKKKYDLKLKGMGWFSNKDLLHNEEVIIPKLSPKKMDFYTSVVQDENSDGSEMKVFASLGYDIYLNEEQYPIEFKAMNEMIVSFLKEYLPKYYNKQINESAANVKSLNNDIIGLKDNIKDNQGRIEKLDKEIEKNRTSIKDDSQKLEAAEIKLKERQEELEQVKTKLEQL
ncbi:MAG: coiled-coil domain-containing protein [Fluviicola sp.]